MTIQWKAVEQYLTVVLFVLQFNAVCNFEVKEVEAESEGKVHGVWYLILLIINYFFSANIYTIGTVAFLDFG